jgi:LysR family transcriptional regulator, hydrogen peroxide-inducible genes activator
LALRRGTLDAIILALPFDCGDIEYAEILRDPLVLARPRAWLPGPIDPQSLLLLEEGHCLNDHGLIACGVPKARNAAMVATSLQTLVAMVDAGLGTTFLPQMAITGGALEGRAIDTAPLGANAERQVVLAWRTRSARAEEFRILARTIAEASTSTVSK